jgi:hypothetical protein
MYWSALHTTAAVEYCIQLKLPSFLRGTHAGGYCHAAPFIVNKKQLAKCQQPSHRDA